MRDCSSENRCEVDMFKTTANKITIARIILIPVFLVLAYTGHMLWALAV